jgi:hypothetical protein
MENNFRVELWMVNPESKELLELVTWQLDYINNGKFVNIREKKYDDDDDIDPEYIIKREKYNPFVNYPDLLKIEIWEYKYYPETNTEETKRITTILNPKFYYWDWSNKWGYIFIGGVKRKF